MAKNQISTVNQEDSFKNSLNPFNPRTTIRFALPKDGHIQLNIYSVNGQKVRTLIDGQVSKGYHQIVWDGTNESGQWASSGLYVYELKTNYFFETKKVPWRYYHNFTNN